MRISPEDRGEVGKALWRLFGPYASSIQVDFGNGGNLIAIYISTNTTIETDRDLMMVNNGYVVEGKEILP